MKDVTQASQARPTDAAVTIFILALGLFLAFAGLSVLERWRGSALRLQSLQLDDVLGFAAAAVGTLIVAWWVTSLILAVACARLHKAGHSRTAAAVGKVSPAFMRRLALTALGLQLVAGPVMAHAAPVPHEASDISAQWAPDRPRSQNTEPHSSPHWLATQETQENEIPILPQWKPTSPPNNPRLVTALPLRDAPPESPLKLPDQVTVLAGDSLWMIAARALGPQASDFDIALAWPRWYEANKATIGDTPDVLLPGLILQAPPPS